MSFAERVLLSAYSQHDGEGSIVVLSAFPGVVHYELSGSVLRSAAGAAHIPTHITPMHSKPEVAFCLVSWMTKDGGREWENHTRESPGRAAVLAS